MGEIGGVLNGAKVDVKVWTQSGPPCGDYVEIRVGRA